MSSATESLIRRGLNIDHGIKQLRGQCDTVKLFQGKERDENLIGVSSREDGRN